MNLEGWSATHSYWCLRRYASSNNPSARPSTNRKGLVCSSQNSVSKREQCPSAKGTDKYKLIYRSLRTQNLRDAPDFCASINCYYDAQLRTLYTVHELYGGVDSPVPPVPDCSGQVNKVLYSTALNQRKSNRNLDYKVCLCSTKPSLARCTTFCTLICSMLTVSRHS